MNAEETQEYRGITITVFCVLRGCYEHTWCAAARLPGLPRASSSSDMIKAHAVARLKDQIDRQLDKVARNGRPDRQPT